MTLTQLTYVLAVADHKNFGAAANASFVTQPTLSMQIQKFEEELGLILFDRSKQPIEPTSAGRAIIAHARSVLVEAEKIKSFALADQEDIQGELRLGVIPTLAPYILPLFLKKFVESQPLLQVVVEELQTQQILDRLQTGELDAAIAVTPLHSNSIVEELLFYEPFLLYLAPDHALLKRKTVQESDLSSSEVWLLSEGHCFRDQAISLCRHTRKSAPRRFGREKVNQNSAPLRFESGNLETLKKMVDQGSGYTLLPLLAAHDIQNRSQKERLREFSHPMPTREVSLIYGKLFSKKATLKALSDEIKKSLPKDVSLLSTTRTKRVNISTYE